MTNKFVILRAGILETYTKYEDIPESFDNVIEFIPEIPESPHSEDEHELIHQWSDKLTELLKRQIR
jgi:hypothetical protein